MIRLDLSGSRFDMSENTAEYAFAHKIAAQTGEDKGIETIDPNPPNLALGAEIVKAQTTISMHQAVKLVDGNRRLY